METKAIAVYQPGALNGHPPIFLSQPLLSRPAPFLRPKGKKKISRQLTPAKLGIAWEKVRRVVRDQCRLRGPDCSLCHIYGGEIEFQLTAKYHPIMLDRDGDRIFARVGNKQWTIRMIRIKTGGSAYEFCRQHLSATRLIVELLHQAAIFEKARNTDTQIHRRTRSRVPNHRYGTREPAG